MSRALRAERGSLRARSDPQSRGVHFRHAPARRAEPGGRTSVEDRAVAVLQPPAAARPDCRRAIVRQPVERPARTVQIARFPNQPGSRWSGLCVPFCSASCPALPVRSPMGLMMDVGTELRKGRERRGISLAVVAAARKSVSPISRPSSAAISPACPAACSRAGFCEPTRVRSGWIPKKRFSIISPIRTATAGRNRPLLMRAAEQNVLSPVEMEELERRSQRKQLLGGAVVLLIGPLLYFAIFGRHSAATSSCGRAIATGGPSLRPKPKSAPPVRRRRPCQPRSRRTDGRADFISRFSRRRRAGSRPSPTAVRDCSG